jgi:L-aminopeptidase/D-esterase-like protein
LGFVHGWNNATRLGDIIDPHTQQVVAGANNPSGKAFLGANPFSNTTIAVIATSASLTKDEANKMAQMAHNGIALTIRPAHTMFDGDTIFALALGQRLSGRQDTTTAVAQISTLGNVAATTLARAIVKAVHTAHDLHGVPAMSQYDNEI